jgi:hypothetical protein
MRDTLEKITNHPIFIFLAGIGIVDMVVLALTNGKVKLIQSILSCLFSR